MTKRRPIEWIFFTIVLFLISFIRIGDSSFVISGQVEENVPITFKEGDKAVCYIKKTPNVLYTKIETALGDAQSGDTVFVIPGTNPTITENCQIKSGVTFCLPYEGESFYVNIDGMKDSEDAFKNIYSEHPNFADSEEAKYLKSNVTIAEGITLTNYGTLQIGGILGLGQSGQRPVGHTVHKYCQLTFSSGSSLENYGNLECRGFMKSITKDDATCSVINNAGASVLLPLVIYDFRGGSYSSACDKNSVFPFSIFDMPNCQINSIYKYGSSLSVLIHAYANNKVYAPDPAVLISSNAGLFRISSGEIGIHYASSTFPVTTNDAKPTTSTEKLNKMKVRIAGDISIESLSFSLAGLTVNSSKYLLPLSYKFDVEVVNGSHVSLKNKIKFLSGSKLVIDSGAEFNVTNNLLFYQKYENRNTLIDLYPKKLGPARCINNGFMSINSAFSGYIETEQEGSSISTGSSFTATMTPREVLTGSSLGTKYTYIDIDCYGFGDIGASNNRVQFVKSANYNAVSSENNFYWSGPPGPNTVDELEGDPIDSGGCFEKGTPIMLADGTYRNVEDLKYGDEIMTWNFFTGKYEAQKIAILVDHGEDDYDVAELKFSDGTELSIIADHGVFDYDLNQYVYLTCENFSQYIGHRFVKYAEDSYDLVTLVEGRKETKRTNAYSITSAFNYNSIANGLFTAPPPGEFYNWVEMDGKLRYDVEQFKADVEAYGLYDYSVFEPYGISYETFIAFNGAYLKIPVSKGIFTFDYIIELFNMYRSWIQ